MQQMLKEWLPENWGWVVLIFCTLFEVAPVKIHPVTSFLGWVGTKLTGEIRKEIENLRRDVDQIRMDEIRAEVLDFGNSCLNRRKHTKEEFEHIIAINKTYEELVKRYDVKNDVYAETYSYILRLYRIRMDKRDFLAVPEDLEEV